MRRVIITSLALTASALCGVQAAFSATAQVGISANFIRPAGITVGNTLTLPTVTIRG